MDKKNPRIPKRVIISWFFLAVAIAGTIPMVVWGETGNYGEVLVAIGSLLLISIPASAFSLLCGVLAVNESALSYTSIVPALGNLLYCGCVLLRILFPLP
jgi:hypothetical protein